jgi:hypothetical protein
VRLEEVRLPRWSVGLSACPTETEICSAWSGPRGRWPSGRQPRAARCATEGGSPLPAKRRVECLASRSRTARFLWVWSSRPKAFGPAAKSSPVCGRWRLAFAESAPRLSTWPKEDGCRFAGRGPHGSPALGSEVQSSPVPIRWRLAFAGAAPMGCAPCPRGGEERSRSGASGEPADPSGSRSFSTGACRSERRSAFGRFEGRKPRRSAGKPEPKRSQACAR